MKIKKMSVHKPFPEFDTEVYEDIAQDYALHSFTDKPINKDLRLGLVFICKNGVFAFIASKTEDKEVIRSGVYDMRSKYVMPASATYTFVRTDEKDYFFDDDKLSLVKIDDMADRFDCLITNTVRPQVDVGYIGFGSKYDMLFEPELPEEYKDDNGEPVEMSIEDADLYVQNKLSDFTVDLIAKKLSEAVEDEGKSSSVRYDSDGNKYVKRAVKAAFGSYAVKDEWYPVATDDPSSFFIMAVLGGWFGLHKFKSRDYLQGLFYLLTCGGFGIFYIFDILQMVTGSYFVVQKNVELDDNAISERYAKRRVYLDKLGNKALAIGGLLASVVIAFVAYKFAYCNIVSSLGLSVSNVLTDSFDQGLKNGDLGSIL